MFNFLIMKTLSYNYPKAITENIRAFEKELARATEALDDFIEIRLHDAMNEDIEKASKVAKDAFAKAMSEERVEVNAFSKEQTYILTEFTNDASEALIKGTVERRQQMEEAISKFLDSFAMRLSEQSMKLDNAIADDRKEMEQALTDIGAPLSTC